ncbi:MAG: cell division FtsA domain-containing protein [Alphaproteobacteria bacterium]|nr:MAG: hypothetical protein B6I23_00375 [Rickettsiaceae bacterium 4572_127]
MKKMENNYTFIELGASRITAINVDRTSKGFVPTKFISKSADCFDRGTVSNAEIFVKTILEIKDEFDHLLKKPIEAITVSISGLKTLSEWKMVEKKFDSETTITKTHIEEIIASIKLSSEKKILHIFSIRYEIDGRITENPEGMFASEIKVFFHLVSMQKKDYEDYERYFKRANLKLENIISQQIAVSNFPLSVRQKKEGVILIDFGEKYTQLALWKNRSPMLLETLFLGANLITTDIQKILNVDFEEAKKLKENHGRAWVLSTDHLKHIEVNSETKPLLKLTEITYSRTKEIFEMIRVYINSKNKSFEINEIVLTGQGAKIPYVRELVNNIFINKTVTIFREKTYRENIISTAIYGLILTKQGIRKTTPESEAETKNLVAKALDVIKNYI